MNLTVIQIGLVGFQRVGGTIVCSAQVILDRPIAKGITDPFFAFSAFQLQMLAFTLQLMSFRK